MIKFVIGLVIYLAIGWRVADIIDVEDALLHALITLFWPPVVVIGLLVFIFWG